LGLCLAHFDRRRTGLRGERRAGWAGLGWFNYENKNQLEVPSVFAGLFCVILIGLAVENLIFRNIEMRTVRRWGMQG
jgi:NitT/TauT family transport system permease protein